MPQNSEQEKADGPALEKSGCAVISFPVSCHKSEQTHLGARKSATMEESEALIRDDKRQERGPCAELRQDGQMRWQRN
jgi:hypothetical protein